jgi:type IV secretory pathway protease TraF
MLLNHRFRLAVATLAFGLLSIAFWTGSASKPLPEYKITFGDSWPIGFGWILIVIAALGGLMRSVA